MLAGTKLIAEAWDAAGLYQVGSFVGDTWQEWNGRFRDDVRRFWKGEEATVPRLATRLLGSPDLFGHEEREAEQSINFVTCHDGFTLNDLVSYDRKHNEANGEDNRDGSDENLSWNCGAEGPTDDPEVEALRTRQAKNFLTVLMLGWRANAADGRRGPPQPGRQQQRFLPGREASWLDWRLLERHAGLPARQVPVHFPPAARRGGREGVVHPEPAAAVGAHRVARRALAARLERPLAFARLPARTPYWRFALPRHVNAYSEPLTFDCRGAREPYRCSGAGHRPAVTDDFCTPTRVWRR